MRRKGFTLVELLVVIAIIALLMGILMPALARVRQMAYRMVCGTRLAGIGKALLVYAQAYDDDYPRSGGRRSTWSTTCKILNWEAETEVAAFGEPPDAPATIGSCFYLLLKYADATPKQFICNGDIGTEVFKMSDYAPTIAEEEIDAWDFGTQPGIHYSYAYHMPFKWTNTCTGGALNTTSNPSSPVCADRNLYLDENAEGYADGADSDDASPTWVSGEFFDSDHTMNAAAHQRDGQSVLYNDMSVRFQLQPNCGITNDNIYKKWPATCSPTDEQRQMLALDVGGSSQIVGGGGPCDDTDAFLVNEEKDCGTPAP